MAIKLFVTDLDGTLLPKGRAVPEKNRKAVQDAAAAGITVTIATGRMYCAALPIARTLGVDVPIITYNGSLIKSVEGEELYSSWIAPEDVRAVAAFCRERGWHLQVYSDDVLYYAQRNELSELYEQALATRGEAVGWDGLSRRTGRVAKMLCLTPGLAESEARREALLGAFGAHLDVFLSRATYVEIVNRGVSKATGVERLAQRLGVRREEILAIGDSDNDLPMLRYAGTSIAMGNAAPEIRAACDHVTGICEDGGFADAIYRYALQGWH